MLFSALENYLKFGLWVKVYSNSSFFLKGTGRRYKFLSLFCKSTAVTYTYPKRQKQFGSTVSCLIKYQ